MLVVDVVPRLHPAFTATLALPLWLLAWSLVATTLLSMASRARWLGRPG